MCRWLAYTGAPILLSEALYAPAHSLIDQSLHARLGAEATNGDGFGIGWYDAAPVPGATPRSVTSTAEGAGREGGLSGREGGSAGLEGGSAGPEGGSNPTSHPIQAVNPIPGTFRSIEPAWNDRNLHELAEHVSSGHFFAHVRAAIGSPVQQTNCHPFRHDRWLWMHNGFIAELASLKRDLVFAVDPSLYPEITGGTDSEVLFYLALTFGLTDDPPGAVARAIGLVEDVGRSHGVADPFQGTLATTDGQRMWVFRYSSAGESRSLFYTTDVPTLRRLYPERHILQEVGTDARLVVSEPIGDLPGAWREMPESSYAVIAAGHDDISPFAPLPPSSAASAV